MKSKKTTIKDWKNLFTTAQKFKALGCWEWIYDSDVFGVLPDEKGEIGYCAVLGARREIFGLVVYRGTEGLSVYEQMYSEELEIGDPDVPFMQNCLMGKRCMENDRLLISPPPIGKEGCRLIRVRTEYEWRDEWPSAAPGHR